MNKIDVKIRRLAHAADLPLPHYATLGASAVDVYATLGGELVNSGDRAKVPLGIALEIPEGYEAQIRPRSGLADREGLYVHLGTIDSDYRGELAAIIINTSGVPVRWMKGARIAQLVFCPVARANFVEVEELSATARGIGGFGSTGVSGATAHG
jgi:dUTP pyrophosphatase